MVGTILLCHFHCHIRVCDVCIKFRWMWMHVCLFELGTKVWYDSIMATHSISVSTSLGKLKKWQLEIAWDTLMLVLPFILRRIMTLHYFNFIEFWNQCMACSKSHPINISYSSFNCSHQRVHPVVFRWHSHIFVFNSKMHLKRKKCDSREWYAFACLWLLFNVFCVHPLREKKVINLAV